MTTWAIGSVAGLTWEILGILTCGVRLGAFTPPSPMGHQPLCREAPREAEAMFSCLLQAWARPEVPNGSAGGRGGVSTGVGDQDNPKPKPNLWGPVQPLRVQIQAESSRTAVSSLQRHSDQLLTHWFR